MARIISDYWFGFFLVVAAGFIWSAGVIFVRALVEPMQYQLHYLFFRGLAIFVILLAYLFVREGRLFYKNFFHIGYLGWLGAVFLSASMILFIISMTTTSAAVALFMMAIIPFIAAILAYYLLKETLNKTTLLSMVIAFLGVIAMIYHDFFFGSVSGAIYGFLSAACFGVFTVLLRYRPETPKFSTIALAGLLCLIFSAIWLSFDLNFTKFPSSNVYLALGHGAIVAIGLILYGLGARYLPAVELALLMLLEVVGGILWAYLPFFGIAETPSMATLFGGGLICLAVVMHGLQARRRYHHPIT